MTSPITFALLTAALLIYGSPEAIAHDKHHQRAHPQAAPHFNHNNRHRHTPQSRHGQLNREQARWQQWHRKQHARGAYHRHHAYPNAHRHNAVKYQGPRGLSPHYRSTIRTQSHRGEPVRGHISVDTRLQSELRRMGVNLRF